MNPIKSNKIFNQIISFVLISGIGWIFDFATFYILSSFFNLKVMAANMISAIPALTYVFALSNKKIFKNNTSKIPLKYKYIIYFIYQLTLITCVSFLGEVLYNSLIGQINNLFILSHLKIVIKIIITPITMTLNFIIMKNLIEKI